VEAGPVGETEACRAGFDHDDDSHTGQLADERRDDEAGQASSLLLGALATDEDESVNGERGENPRYTGEDIAKLPVPNAVMDGPQEGEYAPRQHSAYTQ